ncbi:NETI motif-containing protein [Pueribacillus sp. YX66]|uniref:NETI motif-containing protein n=1 Tax=Pueribacillus sp. YX66 TaxID=3229242 RepID=UPI00358D84F4
MPQKKKFEVLENETIGDCLERMKREGYKPVRRIEKPIFQQKRKKSEPEYLKQSIIFEGIKEGK